MKASRKAIFLGLCMAASAVTVPTIASAGIAVDIRDLAVATRGRHETRIEGEDPLILGQVGDVQHVGTNCSR